MLTGVHILLTYQCTSECDHLFLLCSPGREGTFTIGQLRESLREIKRIKTVDTVYFEGGEPFLFYSVLLAGLRMVYDAGLQSGIVTNGYWATSPEDAEQWLRPMLDLGVADFSVSDDEFHSTKGKESSGAIAYRVAKKLGLPCAKICIKPPIVSPDSDCSSAKGHPVTGGGVLFKGRAAEKPRPAYRCGHGGNSPAALMKNLPTLNAYTWTHMAMCMCARGSASEICGPLRSLNS